MPSVYVGTYSKYNRDSIGGAWLDLEDYGDKDEFMKARQELHEAPYTCKYCGMPSWIDPSDQSPPPDYCHEIDHGTSEDRASYPA